MEYKIIEANIKVNGSHGDYIIAVAIESSPGYWKAYTGQENDISKESLINVAKYGKKLSKHRAIEIFDSIGALDQMERIKFEG